MLCITVILVIYTTTVSTTSITIAIANIKTINKTIINNAITTVTNISAAFFFSSLR